MKRKILPWIIALSALSVSVSAAFYSVSGLGKMFAGASLQVMILAGSLELAKLVTASLLYEYWDKLNKALKYYLLIATFILIAITSAGIYGFLSSAYQETAFKVENQDKSIGIVDKKIEIIRSELSSYEKQIEQKNNRLTQITNIRSNLQGTQDQLISQSRSTSSVRQQIKDIDSEIKRIDSEVSILNDSISSKNSRISSLESQKLEISSNTDLAKEVGPLKYLANLTGKSLDEIVNWYIIVLMLVFDPLAIALVLAANFAFTKSREKEEPIREEIPKEAEKVEDPKDIEPERKKIEFHKENTEGTIEIKDFVKKETEEEKDKYTKEEFGGYKSTIKKKIFNPQENPLTLR
jgi:archaellum component FlaC